MVEIFIIASHPAVTKKRSVISFFPPFSLSSFSFLVLALAAKHRSHVSIKSGSLRDNWYPIDDAIVVMCKVSTSQSLIKRYLTNVPPEGRVWHKAFFLGRSGRGPWSRCVRRLQKCLVSRRHSPKKKRLWRQAINLTPPRRVKTWVTALWNSRKLTVRHECQTVCWKVSAQSRIWSSWYLSLFPTRQDDTRSMTRRSIIVGFRGGKKVGHEPRLEPCWTVLVIDPLSAMWAWWALLDMDPNLGVTLYRWPAKQTIPLSVLARNQTKGFWTWNLGGSGSGNGTRKRVGWEKELTGSWRGDTDRCGRLWTQ